MLNKEVSDMSAHCEDYSRVPTARWLADEALPFTTDHTVPVTPKNRDLRIFWTPGLWDHDSVGNLVTP